MADKIIGVIGGLGPAATLDFCERVLRNTPAQSEQDHIHCLVDNNPKVPNRNNAIAGEGPSPAPYFTESAKRLAQAGADFIVMPCNTAHAFSAAITDAVSTPFVSIIDETCTQLQQHQVNSVGLLAADGCLQAGLYQAKLAQLGFTVQLLSDVQQAQFMQTIYAIKTKGVNQVAKQQMQTYAQQLIDQGAQLMVAGCTEVPLVLQADDLSVPLLETTEILAQQCVRYAKGELSLPA